MVFSCVLFVRFGLKLKLKEIYSKLLNHYKTNDCDKQKIKLLKNVIKTFGETGQKNNIITELAELFFVNNNFTLIHKLSI